jgi:hypothetical protein
MLENTALIIINPFSPGIGTGSPPVPPVPPWDRHRFRELWHTILRRRDAI